MRGWMGRRKTLREDLHIEGAQFIGNGYGYDVYNILTFAAAQEFRADDAEGTAAGTKWVRDEATFNMNVRDNNNINLIFITPENTNRVVLGIATGLRSDVVISREQLGRYIVRSNCRLQNSDGYEGDSVTLRWDTPLPLYLVPNFTAENVVDGMIINPNDTTILEGTYKGFLDPNNIPESVTIPQGVRTIKSYAFEGGLRASYPVDKIVIGSNVITCQEDAFKNFTGRLIVHYAGPVSLPAGWHSRWTNRASSTIQWEGNDAPAPAGNTEAGNTEVDSQEQNIPEEQPTEAPVEREPEISEPVIKGPGKYYDRTTGLRYEVKKDHVVILGCSDSVRGELEIPSELEGKPVTTIGAFAFYGNQNVSAFHVPQSVTVFERGCFALSTGFIYIFKGPKTKIFKDAFFDVSRGRLVARASH